MPVEALLFDLGNVVVDWAPVHLFGSHFDDDATLGRFLGEVCTIAWHTEHDRGVSFAENRIALIERFPEFEAEIRMWDTHWLGMFRGYVDGMPELLETLDQRGVPLYALSNLSAEKWADTAGAFPWLHRFRDVVVSGVEGCVKPDPEIYHIAESRLGLNRGQVLFIDDRMDNVIAARVWGFQAVQFTDAATLRADLQRHGVPL